MSNSLLDKIKNIFKSPVNKDNKEYNSFLEIRMDIVMSKIDSNKDCDEKKSCEKMYEDYMNTIDNKFKFIDKSNYYCSYQRYHEKLIECEIDL